MDNELEYLLKLSRIENLRTTVKIDLLTLMGSPKKIFNADKGILFKAGFSQQNYEAFHSNELSQEIKNIIETCNKKSISIIPISHDEYPEMLKYIPDPPLLLYVRGIIPKSNSIAIVGSRKASGYGIETAFKMASELALSDITIVSGMARGIDTASHSGALDAGGKTVAVLGCGVDIIYPPENRSIMERIIKSGAVISEYPPGSPPSMIHFPSRNRIISGMSLGTLIVEAGLKSGSLITANCALEQGRDVYAIPGNINNYNSMGTNRLIKDGAKIVLNPDDILDELSFGMVPLEKKSKGKGKRRTIISGEKDKKVVSALRIEDLCDEELSEKTNIQLIDLYEVLLDLELKGIIKKSITGKYMYIL
ncbi:MAG: DNA-protecting protein DprA [Clostridiaceae bacterium]|nr:DNA-protecting protein DprA [Clostridiaceae bacterium]